MKILLRFVLNGLDADVKRNFELLQMYLHGLDILKFDFQFFEFKVYGAVSSYAIPHNKGYVPTDILTTAVSGNITFHYELFTDKLIYITTTGAASFRGLLGKYRENGA